jgi:hypothetical protein
LGRARALNGRAVAQQEDVVDDITVVVARFEKPKA